jgi:hypothetical protein
MRSSVVSLTLPAPATLSLEEMEQELIHNMGVDEVTASKWTTGVRTINSSVTSVGDVLSSVTQGRAEAMCFRQGISIQSLAIIKIFLGTPASPAEFGKDTDQDKENDVAVGRGKAKGGGMREASEILAARREKMTPGSYYPPVCFDGHRIDSPSRNMDHLRKLVVQEIHAVCGHLYPDDGERIVILDAITSHCAPPCNRYSGDGHWNYWITPSSQDTKPRDLCAGVRRRGGDPQNLIAHPKSFCGYFSGFLCIESCGTRNIKSTM